jgi:para-nitrobenzyl esterase
LSPILACAADTAGPVVTITGGQIQGRALPNGGAVFKGVPFGAPPVGDLRWREAQPVNPWRGVRDTAEFAPGCMQNLNRNYARQGRKVSEDCLYLNIWTGEWPSTTKKPVMVWIYGGGNVGGFADEDGEQLARKGVVYVSISYRLGVFGFMAHPALTAESPHHASGNYGLIDQISALKWVHDNIARFGGDPNNVLVFGQSAGAGNAAYMLASPLSKGLVQKTIKESGAGAMRDFQSLHDAEQTGKDFAAKLGASDPGGAAGLKLLRSTPPEKLLAAYVAPPGLWEGKGIVTGAGGRMEPIIDGYYLRENPRKVFASGKAPNLPLLLGNNMQEQAGPTIDDMRRSVAAFYGSNTDKVLTFYGLDQSAEGRTDPQYGTASLQFQADYQQRCGAVQEAIWRSSSGATVYEYQWDRAMPGYSATFHSGELPYVFGLSATLPSGQAVKFEDTDRILSEQIQTYWTNFAKTGNPNSTGLPQWPKFKPEERSFLEFTDNGPVVKQNLRQEICALYMDSLAQQMKAKGH